MHLIQLVKKKKEKKEHAWLEQKLATPQLFMYRKCQVLAYMHNKTLSACNSDYSTGHVHKYVHPEFNKQGQINRFSYVRRPWIFNRGAPVFYDEWIRNKRWTSKVFPYHQITIKRRITFSFSVSFLKGWRTNKVGIIVFKDCSSKDVGSSGDQELSGRKNNICWGFLSTRTKKCFFFFVFFYWNTQQLWVPYVDTNSLFFVCFF